MFRHASAAPTAFQLNPTLPMAQMTVEVKRLDELKSEHNQLQSRLLEIQSEVETILGHFNSLAPADSQIRGIRHKVEKPRPFEDKLSIAAGRSIVRAMRQGKGPDECRKEGLRAAKALAMKHKVAISEEALIQMIQTKIRSRFPALA